MSRPVCITYDSTCDLTTALLERFNSAAGNNFINYSNADYDALFAQASATTDDDAQTELYKQ